MTDLRDELERIADHAPTVMLSPDLYARARRAHVRSRLLTVSAAAVCLMLLVSVLAIRPWHTGAPRPANGYPAPAVVPDRIYVPDDESKLPVQPDIGVALTAPVVAAYLLQGGAPDAVLIHKDGTYDRVHLPGLQAGISLTSFGFALSPDGMRLAYYKRGKKPGETYVTIQEFDTSLPNSGFGSVSVRVGGKLGALVTGLRWSDDSRWLVWDGQPIKHWHENGASYESRDIAGRIGAEAGDLPAVRGGWGRAAICDDGRVVVANPSGLWSSNGGPAQKIGRGQVGVLTSCHAGVPQALRAQDVSGDQRYFYGLNPLGEPVTGSILVDSDGTLGDTAIWLERPDHSGADRVAWASPMADFLTLATGLMGPDHPTASLPQPPWAPEPVARWIWVGGGLGAATAVGVLAYVLLRRGRRPKLSP